MSAAIAPGTPAASPAEPISAAANGIDAILGDLSADAPETEAANAETGELTEATEPEQIEAPPADKAQRLDDEVLFSEEALQTPEGLKKARERVKDLRRMTHEKYLELKNFERRVVKRHEKLKHQVNQYVAKRRDDEVLVNSVKGLVGEARSGDPGRMVTAIGQLYGMDGIKALELLNSELVNRGKSQLDPQVQTLVDSLKSEIAELKGGLSKRETEEHVARVSTQLSQQKQRLGQQIVNAAAELPHLNRLYAEDAQNVIEHVTAELTELHQSGTRLDIRTYLSNLEQQLAKHFGAGQAPKGDGGGPAPKQPSQVQRSPGQSVGPRTAAASNPRVPTEDESLRALASDEAFLSQFGL